MTPTRRHDILSALGAVTMAIDALHTLPVAPAQDQWLGIIKRNLDVATALVQEEPTT